MASQKGLGRGLGALLGDFAEEPREQSPYRMLPIYKVEPNPDQPRQDFDEEELEALSESIQVHGVIQPLTVRELPSGYYQIIAGERRWRAARMAGLSEIPAVVIEADDKKAMAIQSSMGASTVGTSSSPILTLAPKHSASTERSIGVTSAPIGEREYTAAIAFA